MFYINGQYTPIITIKGVRKIIAKIGDNKVFYHCITRKIQKIGSDKVTYAKSGEYIEKIGELEIGRASCRERV